MLRVAFRQAGDGEKLEFRLEGEGIQGAPWRGIEAPLSASQLEELRWYVEEFMDLPVGGYAVKARRIEGQMEAAGRRLLDAVFSDRNGGAALDRTLGHDAPERWLEVVAEPGTSAEPLAWPWELLHDDAGFLAMRRLRVRRTLPHGGVTPARPADMAARRTRGLRVLVIVCRPDDQGLVAPRATVDAMLRAVADQPVRVDLCRLGTLATLGEMLGRATDGGDPYDIVHINAHGRFDRKDGASLAFEKEPDEDGTIGTDPVKPDRLGEVLHDKGVDLVLLEACQSATTDRDAPLTAGFAQGLLQKGVRTVVAMGYTVHVDATAQFFGALYERIAAGATVGDALTTARERLSLHPERRMGFGPEPERESVDLRDWFVPQLYQHGEDRALLPAGTVATPPDKPPELRRSAPDEPKAGAFLGDPYYNFVGRVAELHKVGRALERSRAVLVYGLAGTGKTSLATEVAAWALRTRRFEDALFVDFRAVVSEGHALSVMGAALLGGQTSDRAQVVAAFRKRAVVVVWDNMESLADAPASEVAGLGALLRDMVRDDGGAATEGRLLLTSRDPKPGEWDVAMRVPLGGLWRFDARELLSRVLRKVEPPVGFLQVLEREGRAAGKTGAEAITVAGRESVDGLLEFLGDHPLSIEVVGPALATEAAGAIREGIAGRVAAAKGGGGAEAERLRKLEASLAWSIGRLDEGAQEVLRWLALFREGVFEDMVLGMSQLDGARLEAARTQLVRGGLVTVDWTTQVNKRPYLVLHPTLALLGAGELEGDSDVRQRFVKAYRVLCASIKRGIHGTADAFRSALNIYQRPADAPRTWPRAGG
jgi:predicted ATPase